MCRTVLIAVALASPLSWASAFDPGGVRQFLRLLAGTGGEYQEAFDDHGAIVREKDIAPLD